jgi:hypothetical protein
VGAVLPAAYGTPALAAQSRLERANLGPSSAGARADLGGCARARSAGRVRCVRLRRTPVEVTDLVLPAAGAWQGSWRRGAAGHRPLFGFVPSITGSWYTRHRGRSPPDDLGALAQRLLDVIDVDRYGGPSFAICDVAGEDITAKNELTSVAVAHPPWRAERYLVFARPTVGNLVGRSNRPRPRRDRLTRARAGMTGREARSTTTIPPRRLGRPDRWG